MLIIPKRLVSNEEKVTIIADSFCDNCNVFRRSDGKGSTITPGGGIDAGVWDTRELFGMSMNIFLCNTEELGIKSFQDDVNIVTLERNNTLFESNEQLETIDLGAIIIEKKDSPIFYVKVADFNGVTGDYPFKKDQPDEEFYNFKIEVTYVPMLLNAFHMQIRVTSEEFDWTEITRGMLKKKYLRAISTHVRSELINNRKIHLLN